MNVQPGGPTGPKLAITYCPLTGSSLVFDRESVGGATIGVSGITFMNNLVLWNRREPNESLWPQMLAEARCGSGVGAKLAQHPFVEMEWSHWLELHPTTSVLAQDQGFDPIFFEYDRHRADPYGLLGCVGGVPSKDPPVAVAQAVAYARARENGPGGDAPGPSRQAARSSCGPIS